MIPLTKTYDPADLTPLSAFVTLIKEHGGKDLAAQDPARVWEYAMALEAWNQWMLRPGSRRSAFQQPWRVLDVGGAGSPLAYILTKTLGEDHVSVTVCDPKLNVTVEQWAIGDGVQRVDAIFSISTIEHIPHPVRFIEALAALLVPGGLCFLTTDYWDNEGQDQAHFHWMRERIYNRQGWAMVARTAVQAGMARFGEQDDYFHGNQLYGSYTFASMALVKKEQP